MPELDEFAAVFKALSDPLRLRLLEVLPGRGEGRGLPVCKLARRIGISQPCLSHHLNVLKTAGLVGYEKDGCSVFYFVEREGLARALREFNARMGQE